jgi:hypothetical protein
MDSPLKNWIKINFDITIIEDFSMTVVFFFLRNSLGLITQVNLDKN